MQASALKKNTLLIIAVALFITGCNTMSTKVDFDAEALGLDNYNFKTFDSKDYVITYKERPDYESIKWGGSYYAGAGCPKLLFNFEGLTKEIIDAKKDFDYVECLGFWNAGMLNKLNYSGYPYTKKYGRELLLNLATTDSLKNKVVYRETWIKPPTKTFSWTYRTNITQVATGLYYLNSELDFTDEEEQIIKSWFDRRFNEIYTFRNPDHGKNCSSIYGSTKGQLSDQCNNTAAQVANGAAMIGVHFKDPVYIDRSLRILRTIMEGTWNGVAMHDAARGGKAPHYLANAAGYLVHTREVLLNAGVDIYALDPNKQGFTIVDMINYSIDTLLDPTINYPISSKRLGRGIPETKVSLAMTPHEYLYIMKPFIMEFRPELKSYVSKPANHHVTVHVPVYMDYYVK